MALRRANPPPLIPPRLCWSKFIFAKLVEQQMNDNPPIWTGMVPLEANGEFDLS